MQKDLEKQNKNRILTQIKKK